MAVTQALDGREIDHAARTVLDRDDVVTIARLAAAVGDDPIVVQPVVVGDHVVVEQQRRLPRPVPVLDTAGTCARPRRPSGACSFSFSGGKIRIFLFNRYRFHLRIKGHVPVRLNQIPAAFRPSSSISSSTLAPSI